ncbi:hypothetical protein, partial [Klebsiella pneumoniae]|uniref:hypothetical protein n=1 Tax=Klebsiella pneumoniae TaxID=573 RepID=UPI001C717EB8
APAEATATAKAKAGIPWEGEAVWAGMTRRKPVPGGSMAPSMAPMVLHSPRPAPDSFLRVPATEENQEIKSKGRLSL